MSPGLQVVAWCLPPTHAVSLLEGVWLGEGLWSQLWHIGALTLNFVVCIAVSSRILRLSSGIFRWE